MGIYITLKNDFSFSDDTLGNIIFKETQCNLLYLPFTDTSFHFQKDKEYVTLEVLYSFEDVKQLAILFPSTKRFIAKLKSGIAFSLYYKSHTISFAVREIVNSILHSGFQGDLQKVYLKMKAEELLLQTLALPSVKKNVSEKLNESTVDLLHEAKKFIEANYQQHYSIAKMGRRFGMNTTNFKKGFKQEFAMGPFEFLIKIRMSKAIELVKEKRVAVNQIADAAGYKSVGSFIKAFKKQFHYTPGQMRKTFI
ncbi:virulence regulon transcriptional activator VirF [mine drainage metagenome]|uniref:Virulence regulon transcriptional activator VirF n=1 Tax=mine drainage metagenome TaxID=410659 RepID=A0A1J5S051_9ZZZZ